MKFSQQIYKILFVFLIIGIWTESLEISFLTAFFVGLVSFSPRISKQAFTFLFFLIIMIAIGALSGISFDTEAYAYIKDTVYFVRPVIIFLASYFVVSKMKKKEDFFDLIIYTGFGFAFLHLAYIAINIGQIGPSLDKLRGVYGRANHLEMVALYLVVCVKRVKDYRGLGKIIYRIFTVILVVSFIVYFSRTMLVVFILMVMAHYGLLKLNVRGVVALIIAGIMGGLFLLYIKDYEEPEEPGILDTFLAKVKNSYDEAFKPVKFDIRLNDKRDLWDNWRAYEAKQVFEKIDKDQDWIMGAGFGSTVDVGFEVKLRGEYIRHLPTVHNGIAYVYLKIGILGMLVYILAIFYIYYFYYAGEDGDSIKLFNRILVASSMYLLVSSIVVTGIFVPYDMATLLLGGVFAMKHYQKIENRNFRNERNT